MRGSLGLESGVKLRWCDVACRSRELVFREWCSGACEEFEDSKSLL